MQRFNVELGLRRESVMNVHTRIVSSLFVLLFYSYAQDTRNVTRKYWQSFEMKIPCKITSRLKFLPSCLRPVPSIRNDSEKWRNLPTFHSTLFSLFRRRKKRKERDSMTSACRSKKQLRTRYEPVVLNIIATCNPLSRLKLKKKGRREERRRGEEGS